MKRLVTPAVALFFLVMCSSGPYSAFSVIGEIGSPKKSQAFHVGVMITVGIVLMIVLLAVIVHMINKVQKDRFK